MLHFGTDGVRGIAIDELTPELARDLARAVVRVLSPVGVAVCRDTRESGPALERAIVDGCAAEGVPVHLLGVAPTPAVAFVAERQGWVGIAITASHNPWTDNGIKVFAAGGTKLDDAEQIEIEREWHSAVTGAAPSVIGTVHDASVLLNDYVDHRTGVVGAGALEGLRVVVDCANGAMAAVGPDALRRTGAHVVAINAEPNGRNINDNCGTTAPAGLAARVVAEEADLGIAFDGDGDRMIAVTPAGAVVDGDTVMAIAAADLSARGLLRNRGVVVTVMTNLGFHRAMRERDIDVVVTPVGDRSVLQALEEYDYVLGGEQSGHLVYKAHATTGDGLLAALLLADHLVRNEVDLDAASAVMTRFPQVLLNVRTNERTGDPAAEMAEQIAAAEQSLGSEGRVLVRASGTEPVVRIMVEAATDSIARSVARTLCDAVVERFGGAIEEPNEPAKKG